MTDKTPASETALRFPLRMFHLSGAREGQVCPPEQCAPSCEDRDSIDGLKICHFKAENALGSVLGKA